MNIGTPNLQDLLFMSTYALIFNSV